MTDQFYRNIAELQQSTTACLDYEPEVSGLDSWVLAQTEARAGENILAIGCDSNEQTISLARTVGRRGYVLAIDRSYRALTELSRRSQTGHMEQNIRFLYLNLDDLGGLLRPEDFDRVLCGRAISHVKKPAVVFQAIRRALKPGGVFFFYGPTRKDLMELHLFHAALRNESCENRELLFVEQLGPRYARDAFEQVEAIGIEFPLRFTSPDTLYVYWRESHLYEEELDRDFRYAAVQHFRSYTTFQTAQRLIGIKALNG